MINNMEVSVAIDFDSTCVPELQPNIDIGSIPVLKKLVKNGHKLILWTLRDDMNPEKPMLSEAIQWFRNNKIPLYGIQRNPLQHTTGSPKVYADLIIDDRNAGSPLILDKSISSMPFMDWNAMEEILKNHWLGNLLE